MSMWLIFVLLLVVVLLVSSQHPSDQFGDAGVQAAVVGGTNAVPGRYPWFASLHSLMPGNGIVPSCGGMLIAPDVVLTAAHCGGIEYVSIGKHYLNNANGAEIRKPIAIMSHPQFTMTGMAYDIALVLLDSPSTHKPVKVASPGMVIPASLSLLGFGINRPINLNKASREEKMDAFKNRPTRLQEAKLDVRPCKSLLENMKLKPNDGLICAGRGVSGCLGDSGGPLFIKGNSPNEDIVFGATSFGNECGMSLPAAWTSFISHHSWIMASLRQLDNFRDPSYRRKALMVSIRQVIDGLLVIDTELSNRCRDAFPSLYSFVNKQVLANPVVVGSSTFQSTVQLAVLKWLTQTPCAQGSLLQKLLRQQVGPS